MKDAVFTSAFAAIFRDTLEPMLEEHRAAVRADFRKALAELGTSETADAAAFSTRDAATYLGVSSRTVTRMRNDGRLPCTRIGRQVRFRREDLDAVLEENIET